MSTVRPPRTPDLILRSLPEELIVEVMSQLPAPGFHLASLSCRTLRRISQTARFDPLYTLKQSGGCEARPNQTQRKKPNMTPNEEAQLSSHLRPLLYCVDCIAARNRFSFARRLHALHEKGYCSRCNETHPAIFFSARQRQVPQWKRICIGWEGCLVFCSHKLSLAWEDIDTVVTNAEKADYHKTPKGRNGIRGRWHHSYTYAERGCRACSYPNGGSYVEGKDYRHAARATIAFRVQEKTPQICFSWKQTVQVAALSSAKELQRLHQDPPTGDTARIQAFGAVLVAEGRSNMAICPHQTLGGWNGDGQCSVCSWRLYMAGSEPCGEVNVVRRLRVDSPCDYGWIASLDPAS
ncbi:uncharacterized protein VDAG_05899 [Verticillium dahliae VdLs.17]|uniref:F-box domain-containing protein n=1 Tax=Verticillium dahliae (strain VdLs.17 / ATCC MYA-4575 / FGSC 10137) TaxID=498257 RepID=G2X6W7_VERDV|nr:uncharacterized protein VDAG_05899 [Verticillium dahliae VdLs.17]EGY14735.1 hypothetical protein VDAG_05899 [Verticillium dahliae VdLs.17]